MLTYDIADDIALALEDGAISVSDLPLCQVEDVSPALDLSHARPESILNGEGCRGWLVLGEFDRLLAAAVDRHDLFRSADGAQGLISIANIQTNPSDWTEFASKAKAAAVAAGFSSDHSGKLLAAIREFYSNVVEHSENVNSGQVLYAVRANRFEFVVRDRGVGVLRSLQKNHEYSALSDSGSALELALQEGVSRHAVEQGHGLGFRPLFVGLANISEYMRFRSGGHCRELFRRADGDIHAYTKQSSTIKGFSCSVICTPKSI